MRVIAFLVLFGLPSLALMAQKTLMVERIGTSRRHFFHPDDPVKWRVSKADTVLTGRLGVLRSDEVVVEGIRAWRVRSDSIRSVTVKFAFPRKAGPTLCTAGLGIFTIIGINHLLNHEPVFSGDMLLISGSLLAAGGITWSLGSKRCRIGDRWKVKILDINIE